MKKMEAADGRWWGVSGHNAMFELVLYDEGLEQAVSAMFRSGFYSGKEIHDFFHEIASDEPDSGLNPDTVEAEISEILQTAKKELEEATATWPATTDNDRLTAAFEQLNETGIRAVENYGYMASDGTGLYNEIKGISRWRGYCFYQSQDLVQALLNGKLSIRYDTMANWWRTDRKTMMIGKAVTEALRDHGLEPDWSGDPAKVIELPIEWRRRLS
ncbi:DUF6891 domain-containing protein [Aeoliella mucimassa]|uniref:DUF6891 domain-containing protein n=1 Tax=Aeoliella mucimassa TaxID=2527972 RepID=A0A518AIJ2_9BACT|nr:hypothetical protein [Aeoliella mucimassa]QDU54551.1 hypothetical protein Pan181_07340 [Aeoliella mucimassa]